MKKLDTLCYLEKMQVAIAAMRSTTRTGRRLETPTALELLRHRFIEVKRRRKKLIFIGNGGSAAVAGHMSEDFTKVGKIRAICFNDAPFLTCLGNDYSFEQIFEKAIEFQADRGDLCVGISSSGRSKNIINGIRAARKCGCFTVTLSGFKSGNPLSRSGDLNLHLPTSSYGVTELAHETVLHYVLDVIAGTA